MTDNKEFFMKGDAAQDQGDYTAAREAFEKGAELGDGACLSRLAYMWDLGLSTKSLTQKLLPLRT